MSQYAVDFEIILPNVYQRDFHLERNVINKCGEGKLNPTIILVTLFFHHFKQ